MKQYPLKQLLAEHFGSRQLSAKRRHMLHRMIRRAQTPFPYWLSRRQVLFAAASLSAVLVSVAVLYGMYSPYTEGLNIHQRIADEVARNHIKQRPLDVQATRFPEVQRFFNRLNFSPIEPQWRTDAGAVLIGGRYCSIQGEEAAQLRFVTANGGLQTLYEAPYDVKAHKQLPDIIQGEQPLQINARGLKVYLWQQRGLLFVSAGE